MLEILFTFPKVALTSRSNDISAIWDSQGKWSLDQKKKKEKKSSVMAHDKILTIISQLIVLSMDQ